MRLRRGSSQEAVQSQYMVDGGYVASSKEEQQRLTLRDGMSKEEEAACLKARQAKFYISLVRHNIMIVLVARPLSRHGRARRTLLLQIRCGRSRHRQWHSA